MKNTKKMTSEEIESKLISLVGKKFSNSGIEKITMDELASELHISKKSIYKVYSKKEDIIRNFLIGKLNFAYTIIVTNIQARTNIVEKFVELSKMVKDHFILFNEASLEKLAHYYPDLTEGIILFKNERVIPLIKLLIRIGKKKKIISEVEDDVIIKVFTASLSSISQMKKSLGETEYQKTFEAAFYLLLNGILTKKGKQLLIKKRINNESN